MTDLHLRAPTPADIPLLAEMNQQLIHDEGHRKPDDACPIGRTDGWLSNRRLRSSHFRGGHAGRLRPLAP